MRGKTLAEIHTDLKSEIWQSVNPALGRGTRDNQLVLLRRTQERLWQDNDWPHLMVERSIPLQNGLRYYNFPSDLDLDRVSKKVWVKYSDVWTPVEYGISQAQYNSWDSDLDERDDLVRRWEIVETSKGKNQFEVWPIPNSDQNPNTGNNTIKLRGIRKLRPFVADNDVADLDDRLIIMYAASEILMKGNQSDAEAKLAQGQQLLSALLGNQSKSGQIQMGAGEGIDLGGTSMDGESRIRIIPAQVQGGG